MTYKENNIPMSMWAEDDKPSEKLLMKGRTALSDAEMISIIIGPDRSGFSSLNIARVILKACDNNLYQIARLNFSELKALGLSKSSAVRLLSAFELGRRRSDTSDHTMLKITQSRHIFEILSPLFMDNIYESFYIVLLNRSNRLIRTIRISEGGISGTVVDPKKVFKIALDNHAPALILGHNHPSGNIQPSEADKKLTRKFRDAGILLDIDILDHVIVSGDSYYSFADNGEI